MQGIIEQFRFANVQNGLTGFVTSLVCKYRDGFLICHQC